MLAFLGDNGRDHLLAAVSNTLGEQPGCSSARCTRAGSRCRNASRSSAGARTLAALHHELAQEMTQAVDHAPAGARGRIRVGIYTYYEDESAPVPPRPPESEPTP
jgi:hypothetical protein